LGCAITGSGQVSEKTVGDAHAQLVVYEIHWTVQRNNTHGHWPVMEHSPSALHAFVQLARNGTSAAPQHLSIQPMSIVDAPQYQWRGFMVDTGRRFWPVPLLQQVMDAMEANKLNVLHLHLRCSTLYTLSTHSLCTHYALTIHSLYTTRCTTTSLR
jgi:hypothetical protein